MHTKGKGKEQDCPMKTHLIAPPCHHLNLLLRLLHESRLHRLNHLLRLHLLLEPSGRHAGLGEVLELLPVARYLGGGLRREALREEGDRFALFLLQLRLKTRSLIGKASFPLVQPRQRSLLELLPVRLVQRELESLDLGVERLVGALPGDDVGAFG